jgi:hypothetical protein
MPLFQSGFGIIKAVCLSTCSHLSICLFANVISAILGVALYGRHGQMIVRLLWRTAFAFIHMYTRLLKVF